MDSNKIAEEIHKLTGKRVPLHTVITRTGAVVSIDYDKEWREGGTEPVEKTTGKGKNAVTTIEYKENYKTVKLTKDEIKKLDAYIDEKLKTE